MGSEMCIRDRLGIHWTLTPAYHPQSNPVERHHRTLNSLIAKLTVQDPKKWVQALPQALYVHRTLVSRTTEQSPFQVLFGREPSLQLDTLFRLPSEKVIEGKLEDMTIRDRIQAAHEHARVAMRATVCRARNSYQGKRVQFSPGQLVWLWTCLLYTSPSPRDGLLSRMPSSA